MTAKKVSKEDGTKGDWLKVHEILITLGCFLNWNRLAFLITAEMQEAQVYYFWSMYILGLPCHEHYPIGWGHHFQVNTTPTHPEHCSTFVRVPADVNGDPMWNWRAGWFQHTQERKRPNHTFLHSKSIHLPSAMWTTLAHCVCGGEGGRGGGSTHNALEMIFFQGSGKLHAINVSSLAAASAFSSITGMNQCLGKTTPKMVSLQKLGMTQKISTLICSNLHWFL